MPHARINGQNLYFEDSGGSGLPVILGHGFLMDHEMFAPQVEVLAGEFRVITWDERGFGLTEFDGQPFSYWDSARDCLGLMDHLGLERAVVGGMSQGGYLSLRLALSAPERVLGLVLIDTQAAAEHDEKRAAYRQMLDAWAEHGPVDPLAQTIATIIIDEPAENARWIAKWRARPKALIREPGRCLLERDDISPRLSEIRCPAIVIHGTRDSAIGMEAAQALADGLGGCDGVVAIEGAAHAANLTHPDQVNPPLQAFLRRLTAVQP
ncbi:MAG: alpha/beta fold hydrolase [Sinimarinibacterium flocculans]|uniref:alpha/beta fold hydrolase n=1 Tax=Sinimarinibacterium flocculans TaxID=985250 RepID=UPI003C4E8B5A